MSYNMGSCLSHTDSQSQPKVYPLTLNDFHFLKIEKIYIRGKPYLINRENYELYNYDSYEYIGVYDEYHKIIIKEK